VLAAALGAGLPRLQVAPLAYADLVSPPRLRLLLERHGLWARRRLGQNFLVDANVVARIVAASGVGPGDAVFEVGPGLGVVTRPLAERAARVVALELDQRLFPALEETLAGLGNVQVVQGDILRADLRTILGAGPWKVVANLPYYVTTPALARLLEHDDLFGRMTLMVQREVADRLAAEPGGREYGALSVFVQSRRQVSRAFTVSPTSFYPAPKVESAVVVLDPLPAPVVPAGCEADFEVGVRAAFGQRRKRLGNALALALGVASGGVDEALTQAGIDPGLRAEALSVAQYVAVASVVRRLREEAAA